MKLMPRHHNQEPRTRAGDSVTRTFNPAETYPKRNCLLTRSSMGALLRMFQQARHPDETCRIIDQASVSADASFFSQMEDSHVG